MVFCKMTGNRNRILTSDFSNRNTRDLYLQQAPINGEKQCGGCSFYALFNYDYGLCCHPTARFYLETVFEHFGCEKNVYEGWEAHSFRKDAHQLPDSDDLYWLLRGCKKAIGGKKGIGIISRDIRQLYLEIMAVLKSYDVNRKKDEQPS